MTERSEPLRTAAARQVVEPGLGAYARKILAVVAKDVAAELRTKEMMMSMFIFSVLVILIFNFAFDLRADNVAVLAPGVLWVAVTFAGLLGLSRSFILERDRGALEGLLLTPVDRSAIYLGKMLGNVLFIGAVSIIILPLFIIFFNQPVQILLPLAGVVLLGIVGLAGVGTLFSAMAIHTRAREVLLPIILFPVVVPVIIASVRLTAAILDATPFEEVQKWLALVAAFDVIFLAASMMLFDFVVEE
jgi:heme exporter protein B